MFCPNPECPDLELSGVRGEYVDGVTTCPRCGATLVHSLDPSTTSNEVPCPDMSPTPAEQLEAVFESWDPTEIPIIRSVLEAAGIPFTTTGEERFDAFRGGRSAHRFNPRAGSVVFLVPADLAEDARALLTEVEPEPGW